MCVFGPEEPAQPFLIFSIIYYFTKAKVAPITALRTPRSSSPVDLPQCHSETLAWTRPPPWTSCTRRIPHPPVSAGAATGRPAAARRRSTDTCHSPTWTDPPRRPVCRTAAGEVRKGDENESYINCLPGFVHNSFCSLCGGCDIKIKLCADDNFLLSFIARLIPLQQLWSTAEVV